MAIITFEPEFRPALPCVFDAIDYQEFRADLVEADRILTETGLKWDWLEHIFLPRFEAEARTDT